MRIGAWVLYQVDTSANDLMHRVYWEKGRGRRYEPSGESSLMPQVVIVEGIDSMPSYWYRAARADQIFARFAYNLSDRNKRVSSYCKIRVSKD